MYHDLELEGELSTNSISLIDIGTIQVIYFFLSELSLFVSFKESAHLLNILA